MLPYLERRGLHPATVGPIFCECESPEDILARRLRIANIPHCEKGQTPRTFRNFNREIAGVEDGLNSAKRFAEGKGPHVLVLSGQRGCGKSHLLEAVGRRVLERGPMVRYDFVASMLDRIRATFERQAELTTEELLQVYEHVPVLILDDLGAEKTTEWAGERLTAIVDSRYRSGKPLAVGTNLEKADFEERGLLRMASRLFDTQTGAVQTVIMTAADYRQEGA